MILYYGADRRLEKPLYNHGRSDNDYGSGFYLTNEKEKAYLWASQYDDGYVIKYNLNLKDLKILYLNTNKQEDVLLWISILVNNRFSKEKKWSFVSSAFFKYMRWEWIR